MTSLDPATEPALRITATDASTVFTGAAHVHRFDAPSSREIAASVRNVLGPHPDGARVHVAADAVRLREIAYALADYDIVFTAEELPTDPAADPAVDPPADPATDAWEAVAPIEAERDLSGWIVLAVALVVSVACAAVVFTTVVRPVLGIAGRSDESHEVEPPAAEVAVESSLSTESSISNESPATVTLERDGLSVELPAGFALEADGEMWRAVGADPNFRLQIAVEHLYQLPAQTMAEQLLADIEADPEVELVDTDGHAVTYLERAKDGSQSLWKTWPVGGTQLFVGCHTRFEPTTVQRATCRMAMESAQFTGLGEGAGMES